MNSLKKALAIAFTSAATGLAGGSPNTAPPPEFPSSLTPRFDPGEQEIIDAKGNFSRLISARYILREGKAPSTTFPASVFYPSYRVDWDKDDAFNRAVNQIIEESAASIQSNKMLRALLDKPSWTSLDRHIWEREVFKTVHFWTLNCAEGNLTKYRSDFLTPGCERSPVLNALSVDIENDTETIENDCDTQAIIGACILQRLEDRFLPTDASEFNFKRASIFFVCYGRLVDIKLESDELREFRPDVSEEELAEFTAGKSLSERKKAINIHGWAMSSLSGTIYDPPNSPVAVRVFNPDPVGDFINGRTLYMVDYIDYVLDSNSATWKKTDRLKPPGFNLLQAIEMNDFLERSIEQRQNEDKRREAAPQFKEDIINTEGYLRKFVEISEAVNKAPFLQIAAELFNQLRTVGLDAEGLTLYRDLRRHNVFSDPNRDSEDICSAPLVYELACLHLSLAIRSADRTDNIENIEQAKILYEQLKANRPDYFDQIPYNDYNNKAVPEGYNSVNDYIRNAPLPDGQDKVILNLRSAGDHFDEKLESLLNNIEKIERRLRTAPAPDPSMPPLETVRMEIR